VTPRQHHGRASTKLVLEFHLPSSYQARNSLSLLPMPVKFVGIDGST
jgi:hypothetical protein